MARRIRSRGKKKFLGNRSHGAGNCKNRRGKGSRGGVGRAGFHKHKWLQTIKRGEIKGEKGFVNPSPSARPRSELREISVGAIQREIDAGKRAAGVDGVYQVALPKFKVLSGGARSGRFTSGKKESNGSSAFQKPIFQTPEKRRRNDREKSSEKNPEKIPLNKNPRQ